jgi:hypothetical protein
MRWAFAQLDLCLCDARSLHDDAGRGEEGGVFGCCDGWDTGTAAGRLLFNAMSPGRCGSATTGMAGGRRAHDRQRAFQFSTGQRSRKRWGEDYRYVEYVRAYR